MSPRSIATLTSGGLLALFILFTLFGSWYTIDQGERGVLLRNGAFVAVVEPGLHFKLPWIDSVSQVDVRTHTIQYEKVNSYSFDQQPADINVSVTYRIDPASVGTIYGNFGGDPRTAIENRIINPRVRQELKVVFGRYTAVSAIQDRAKLNADVFNAVQTSLGGEPQIVLESVQIENIEFSQQYVQSIEARMQAEIEVQRIQQQYQQQEGPGQDHGRQRPGGRRCPAGPGQGAGAVGPAAGRGAGQGPAAARRRGGRGDQGEGGRPAPEPRPRPVDRAPNGGTACCRPPWCRAARRRSSG